MVPKVPCDSTTSSGVRSADEVGSDCSEVAKRKVGGRGDDPFTGVDGPAASGHLSAMLQRMKRDAGQSPTEEPPATQLRAALAVVVSHAEGPLVLAVSGGRDSMAMLHAFARWAPDRVAAVATYDHGTGGFATDAAALVAAEGRRLGLTVVRERARSMGSNEAAWRNARWSFLHRVARAFRARVATAHTQDDQVETVVMRLLRGSGARGLAALAVPSPVVRPWLAVSRAEIGAWVRAEKLPYLDDPTNATLQFLRGRLRHDLLPLLETAHPGFAQEMLVVGERAARWRVELEAFINTLGVEAISDGVMQVPAAALEATTDAGRAVLWSALFARAGVALDARGTRTLVRFTNGGRRGAHVELAGGAVAMRLGVGDADLFQLRRRPTRAPVVAEEWVGLPVMLPPRWGGWRFRRTAPAGAAGDSSTGVPAADAGWHCALRSDVPVRVRVWQPGDRIKTPGARAGRRVTRYFAAASVPPLDRPAWPVVLQEQEIVWVPGVCRAAAAPNRPGRPDVIWYRCEREHD